MVDARQRAALLEHGLIPSAEVLGEVAEQLICTHTARGYADASLRTLMAATYRAGRDRRYPLWWTPKHHARITEPPWVRAVAPWAADPVEQARSTLRTLGEVCVRVFPGAGLPNLTVRVLSGLARLAELPVPFAAEPPADSYSGMAAPEVLAAARTAAELLRGTVTSATTASTTRRYGTWRTPGTGTASPCCAPSVPGAPNSRW
ncbi:hypothetical protein ACFCXF_15695 [Streptomyces virginiae]|uniref:hypothetical protein n=1 Tax=Streptomyces virginiae TaxID=1961 RepID=UPI0035E00B1A